MRDRMFTITLAILLVVLLILAPRHPFQHWRVPCMVFCVASLLWLAPELLATVRRKSTNCAKRHKGKSRIPGRARIKGAFQPGAQK